MTEEVNGIVAKFTGPVGNFSLDAAFTMPMKGVTGLFGPSGCGKTTILRCVAGLTRIARGRLTLDGDVWQDFSRFVPPHNRPVGYVFQESRLFPHLSVLGNLNYAARRSQSSHSSLRLDTIIDFMGIRDLLDRSPGTLSGGERQRVSIGRALLSRPRLLLMDEPLSALDHRSKGEILPYLENLSDALQTPILYVSHDMAEIERLADYLILMSKDGKVQASGPLTALLTDLSLPIARQPEAASVLLVTVESYDDAYDLTAGSVDGVPLFVPGNLGQPGSSRRVRVRASDVSLMKGEPQGTSVLNVLPARVVSAEIVSANQVVVLLAIEGGAGGMRVTSSITRKSWDGLKLQLGDCLFIQIKGMALA